ncbi:hypothetical protein Misp01_02840 [Microtetraspora sp. NBRC 13810]|uniref:DUF397 domain-containing protein n=1 Tax=Microtetraspora sp. NBRC 13810 TaxID=3030990 RepID=UPI0024A21F80|nr:DUF397 domain-containing protein [Microtetraspora sp. NBRC 13810]GLW05154.1 hypothetical protein Misp01_02840 [Microtetraspora sp. NBRC 13810]
MKDRPSFLGATWHSPLCNGGACANAARQDDWIAIRDSKNPTPFLIVSCPTWSQLITAIKSGRLTRPAPGRHDGVPFAAWTSDTPLDDADRLEIAFTGDLVLLRCDDEGAVLRFSAEEWDAFAAAVRERRFDADRM